MDIERENSVNQDRTPEERQESKTKATAFETLYNSLSQTIVMQNQLKNATNEMGELQQRQEKLKALVDSIGKFEVNPDGGIISKNISLVQTLKENHIYQNNRINLIKLVILVRKKNRKGIIYERKSVFDCGQF